MYNGILETVPVLYFSRKQLKRGNFVEIFSVCSRFGSTYTCEQLFSIMKFTKSKLRSRISDVHLEMFCFLLHLTCHQMLKNFHKASSIKCHINVVLLKCENICFAIFVISMIAIVAM